MKRKSKIISLLLLSSLVFTLIPGGKSVATEAQDYEYYQKYELYKKYEKKQKYGKYKKYKRNKKKYGFADAKQKAEYKDKYLKYRLYKKDPLKYAAYAIYEKEYKKYKKYKKYVTPYSKYSRYSKYKNYDKDEYDAGKNYGGDAYKDGHDRYLASQENAGFGEATLGGGVLGPNISVGLQEYTENDLESDYLRFTANKEYIVKNANNESVATIPQDSISRVKYDGNDNLKFYDQNGVSFITGTDVYFEASDGNNNDLILSVEQTTNESGDYDQYRGKLKVHLYNPSGDSNDRIWVINTLPLEQYVWGIGEITGTGDDDYDRTMTVMFRTYGYWKIRWSTQYAAQGFTVVDTSSNQVYGGYDWEDGHPDIKSAAEETQGKIMMYGSEIALSPYSSWTDGRTRSFEERWGSTLYPWCRSVSDPYGDNETSNDPDIASMTTAELVAAGNHMVGLSAHGALHLASDHEWDWEEILRYYFYGVRFLDAY